ncbi:N-acetylmuramoyl-L-alanine amidase [Streptomyces sp. NPDC051907]|uniref:N-acetylmuramoyl-L-alanine amidase n=1 Tax=Streptomyces sp. NPDC051907 TaxID=3155284 RepID=UPI00343108ED
MATPLSATRFLAALRDEGLTVVEVGNWRTHNRGQRGDGWGPVHGVLLHHTVTKGTQSSIDIVRDGYAELPGPLCHGLIDKDGKVYLVGYGRTNHAGLGDPRVLDAVIAEKSLPAPRYGESAKDGNARLYGFECVNLGDGKDSWPAVQVEAMVRASAALVRAHDWGKDGKTSVLAHKEWQYGKPDPRGPGFPTMAVIRDRAHERLQHPPSWSPGDDEGGPSQATYTVRDGDTLTEISERFDVSVDRLAALNKLKDPDEIAVGQRLKLK